ncbi:MAG: hypothetical protein M1824_000003 [Vezdaea acicularis]|nr:MAG: hypothetical protein M1824_000003 [Vezdaea acicularis]
MTDLSSHIQKIVATCRRECDLNDYGSALRVLEQERNSSEFENVIQAETVRVHLLIGDRKSASKILASRSSTLAPNEGVYGELLCIQKAFVEVSTEGNLAAALNTGSILWKTYGSTICVRDCSEEVIFDIWKRYGEGHENPGIQFDHEFLQLLIVHLTKSGLYFEAFELLEYFTEAPESQFENLSSLLVAENNPTSINCILRLTKLVAEADKFDSALDREADDFEHASDDEPDEVEHALDGELDEVEQTLGGVSQLATEKHKTFQLDLDLLHFRYTAVDQGLLPRSENLLKVANDYLQQGHFDSTMQALEAAAELHCQLPVTPQAEKLGIQIHDQLHELCLQSGDFLSQTQFDLRRCDLITSFTGSIKEARTRRDQLLKSQFCSKLPFFGRYHRRQWAEYFMIHQKREALDQAQEYLKYCKIVGDKEKIALAENICLQTFVQPGRVSEESRVGVLEDVRSRLERGIKEDHDVELYLPELEKRLLLVDILDELGTLEGEDREDIFRTAVQILDEAQLLCPKVNFDRNSIFMKYEVGFLRSTFIAAGGLESDSPEPSPKAANQIFEANLELGQEFHTPGRKSFIDPKYLRQLSLVLQNNSYVMFRDLLQKVKDEEKRLEGEGHSLERARFFLFQGCFYRTLIEYHTDESFTAWWLEAGINSRVQGMRLALSYFEKALEIEERFFTEVTSESDQLAILVAEQYYFTGPLELLLFECASEICSQLNDDNDQTWIWIQRRKARGLSGVLRNTFKNRSSRATLELPAPLTFEDALWASRASSRKVVFVDWAMVGEFSPKLILMTLQFETDSDGFAARKLSMEELPMSSEDLSERKGGLNTARLEDLDADSFLSQFHPIIQPLETYTKEGDILVLSPTGPLHNMPLHALQLDGKPLIERNPLVYTPSLSALISCMERLEAPKPGAESSNNWKAAVLGAYDDDSRDPNVDKERLEIYSCLEALADKLGTNSTVGKDVNVSSFRDRATDINLLHFHGHGRYNQHDITRQSLELGSQGQQLTLNDIANLKLNAALATIIACEGGIQDFSLQGDEPFGLLSAFLFGGATSVLGALWPIQSETGRKFTEYFYDYFVNFVDRTELGPIVNLAVAVQQAALKIRECEETRAPYHWAAFVLYGCWFCPRKPGTW